jgi:hypothetical protein
LTAAPRFDREHQDVVRAEKWRIFFVPQAHRQRIADLVLGSGEDGPKQEEIRTEIILFKADDIFFPATTYCGLF